MSTPAEIVEVLEGCGRRKPHPAFPHGSPDNRCQKSSNSLDYFVMSDTIC
jgi:hypothetical protein